MSAINNYDGGLTLSIPVKDLDTSIGWYTEVLGFQLLYRVDDIGWCELQSSPSSAPYAVGRYSGRNGWP